MKNLSVADITDEQLELIEDFDSSEEVSYTEGVIRKVGKEFCIFSKKGKNLGCKPSHKKAVERLKEIESFKSKGEDTTIKKNSSGSPMTDNKRDPQFHSSLSVYDIQFLDKNQIDEDKLTVAGLKRNKDLLYIRFKLCHTGANKNRDEFLHEELTNNFDTALFKPINWEHKKNEIIGCIYDSRFVTNSTSESDAANFTPHIECDGVIYQYQFPVKAQIMKERFEKGNLAFSMETWYEHAECSECGKICRHAKDYCDHLNNRMTDSSTTSRILHDITFGGAGVVRNPADADAVGLSVANIHLTKENLNWIVNDIDSFQDMSAVLDGFIKKKQEDELTDENKLKQKVKDLFSQFISLNDMQDSKGDLIVDDTKKYTKEELEERVNAAVEKAKSEFNKDTELTEINQKLNDSTIKATELTEKLQEATKSNETLKQEFEDFKSDLEKEKKVDARMAELESAGIKFSEERIDSVKAQVKDMTDTAFDSYRDSLKELIDSKANDDDDDPEKNKAKAKAKAEKDSKTKNSHDLPNITSAESKDRLSTLSDVLGSIMNNNKDKE